ILSDYKPDSELTRVCLTAHTRPVPVSSDLFTTLDAARRLSEATGGAFDITLGPVIRLWRQARAAQHVPDPGALAGAARLCGYRKLVLDGAHRTVFLKLAGMQLDLGAIAKGYAADKALAVLRTHGIRSALVAASGDLAIGDAPPGKPGWRVGIDSLDTPASDFTRVLLLHNTAVSTSGDTEQYLETGGRRYSHIVDPKTDLGLTRRISVTIVASRGIDTDSLATAVSVLGAERGMKFIETKTRAAALIVTLGNGAARVRESRRFRALGISGL
ncbi:MAG: FAD:protein FMN transferase, partial [Bryobacteraceae bacterium]